jgi:ribosome-associated protein
LDPLVIRPPDIVLPATDLRVRFSRASGPGGQNVNKVATRAALRFDLRTTQALPDEVKDRLRVLAKGRITARGDLLLVSDRYRDQARNLEDCRRKLRALVLRALVRPRPRRPTRPGPAAVKERLKAKRRQGERKADRRAPGIDDS